MCRPDTFLFFVEDVGIVIIVAMTFLLSNHYIFSDSRQFDLAVFIRFCIQNPDKTLVGVLIYSQRHKATAIRSNGHFA